tara:strand:+ start:158 stop:418 length:261 start_codon:yes stop_codon:yes gene_type:complete
MPITIWHQWINERHNEILRKGVNKKLKLGTHNDSYGQINCIAFRKKQLSEFSHPSLDYSFLATRKPISYNSPEATTIDQCKSAEIH